MRQRKVEEDRDKQKNRWIDRKIGREKERGCDTDKVKDEKERGRQMVKENVGIELPFFASDGEPEKSRSVELDRVLESSLPKQKFEEFFKF